MAIKILDKEKIVDSNDIERVAREIKILKMVNHPNIVRLIETISSSKNIYLVMEFAEGGDLNSLIEANRRLTEKQALQYFLQLLDGVEYIHSLGIVHRDLKPENILLTKDKTTIQIVDFGLSNLYNGSGLLSTPCGSPCYAPPEVHF